MNEGFKVEQKFKVARQRALRFRKQAVAVLNDDSSRPGAIQVKGEKTRAARRSRLNLGNIIG